MKSLMLVLLVCLLANYPCLAKNKDYSPPKRDLTFSVGYGAPSLIRTFLKKNSNHNDYKIIGYGPYMFKADFRFYKRFSAGFNLTYSFSRLSWMDFGYDSAIHDKRLYEYGIEMEEISALFRVNYHFKQTKKIDAYAGAGFGTGRIALGTYTEAPLNEFAVGFSVPRPLALEVTAGMRYFVTRRIGVYTELGLGKSWILLKKYFIPESVIQAGLSVRL